MEEINRPLHADEIRLLNKLKNKAMKKRTSRYKVLDFIFIFLTGLALTDIAVGIKIDMATFVFGTMALLCFIFLVFWPNVINNQPRQQQKRWSQINHLLMENGIQVTRVNALQVAVAREYDDEGDLFIIEYKAGEVLYLWDQDDQLKKRFPCQQFEIYTDDFTALTGRPVHALSERIHPREIDAKSKWKYLRKYGDPGHMTTEQIGFEELMSRF
jgi:ABC-type multidrug transport system fused ATPase/permease subunit